MQGKYIKAKYSGLKHFDFILLDIVAIIASFSVSYILKFHDFNFMNSTEWKGILLIGILVDLLVIMFTAPFSGVLKRYGSEELLCVGRQTVANAVLCIIFLYGFKMDLYYSRTVVLGTYIIYLFVSLLFRILWKKILRTKKSAILSGQRKTIFVVGSRERMPYLLRSINSGFFMKYDVKGICIPDGTLGEKVFTTIDLVDEQNKVKKVQVEYENNTCVENIADYVLKNNIEEVYIGVFPSNLDSNLYKILVENGKMLHLDIQAMTGFVANGQSVTTVGTYKTLCIGNFFFTGKQLGYIFVKRLIDIFFGVVGLIAMFPLACVIKVFNLMINDKAPIFYTQTRVGLGGKPFKMYKFRSMIYNADDVLKELLKDEKYRTEWELNQKFEKDPRITKMGAFLRKTSLDEVPQFINVLKGDMSLIGPRPLVEGELEFHGGLQLYNQVKPGVTGWWGCNGRSNTTYEERLELEYYYVRNCSLYLDLLCIIKTVFVILKRDGAK